MYRDRIKIFLFFLCNIMIADINNCFATNNDSNNVFLQPALVNEIDEISSADINDEFLLNNEFLLTILANNDGNYDEYDDYDDYDDYDEEYENGATIKDPFEKFNRKMFSFNIYILENIGEPTVKGYKFIFPEYFRDRFSNFGDRFDDPLILLNSILQLDIKNSLKTIATFATNMTVGIFGLFNPAKYFGFEREKRTFGDTLSFYGVGNGFYLMLPFIGPTTLRNSIGLAGDYYVNPFGYNGLDIWDDTYDITPYYLKVPKYVGAYGDKLDVAVNLNKNFIKKSFDPYIFTRESYIQNVIYKQKKEKNK